MKLWIAPLRLYRPSNIEILQQFQNETLRNLVDATWCVRTKEIHRYLEIEPIKQKIQKQVRSIKL